MNTPTRLFLIALVGLILITVNSGFYVLPEGKLAVVTQFGKPIESTPAAGLKFKLPFIQEVTYFDKRILIWDGDPNRIPTKDKTFVYLDVTARWRITDALVFLQTVKNYNRAQSILDDILDGTVRDLVNRNNLVEIIVSSDWTPEAMAFAKEKGELEEIEYGRDKITAMIHSAASKITPQYGIELVDVMFKRVNYTDTVRQKVYDRMISERKRIAAEYRSLGEGQKAEIMGRLERELKQITSTANRDAQEIKGKADAEAARISADAYNQDRDFYAFYKSMDTYKKTVGDNSRLVITSDADFYKYLQKMK